MEKLKTLFKNKSSLNLLLASLPAMPNKTYLTLRNDQTVDEKELKNSFSDLIDDLYLALSLESKSTKENLVCELKARNISIKECLIDIEEVTEEDKTFFNVFTKVAAEVMMSAKGKLDCRISTIMQLLFNEIDLYRHRASL